MATKAELEVLKSNLVQAERARDSISKQVADVATIIGRLDTSDREYAENLVLAITAIADALGIENPLKVDVSGYREDADSLYEVVDALYFAVSDLRSRIEEFQGVLDDIDEGYDTDTTSEYLDDTWYDIRNDEKPIVRLAEENY